jgi:hypothetical protein
MPATIVTAEHSKTAEVQKVAVEEEDTEFNDMILSRLQQLEGKKGAGSVTFSSSYTPAQQDVVIRLATSLGLQVHETLLHTQLKCTNSCLLVAFQCCTAAVHACDACIVL